MQPYTIYLGADHRGFEKKNRLLALLAECHPGMVRVEDLGAFEYVEDDDFNEPARAVAAKVAADEHAFGVLLCGSGQGVCIQANRLPGARAVCAQTADEAILGREHDWANIVCLSADRLDPEAMEYIVKSFCHAKPIDDERRRRRIQKLDQPVEAGE